MLSLLDRMQITDAVRECRNGTRKLESLTFTERREYIKYLQSEISWLQKGLIEGLGCYELVYTERDESMVRGNVYVRPDPPVLMYNKEPFQNTIVLINDLLDEFTKVLEAFRWLSGENIEQNVRSELIKELQGKSNAKNSH